MATKKTSNFLPSIFQTDTNNKFLSATMDQLVAEPNLRNIHGYIGRTFAPTYKNKDSYVIENSAERQKYQLEPSIVVRNDQKEITFFASYTDLLNKIEYYGGITADHDRLFDDEYYSFDPQISFDKFINFSQYYWLANGPDPVEVNTTGIDLENIYEVTRNENISRYIFTAGNLPNNTLTLARGGSYTFNINQPGNQFWIQTELGTDGLVNATPTVSTREVLGVINNGADTGTVTFNVPQINAQDRYVLMPIVATVDYAVPLAYADIQNRTVSQFLAAYPAYAGITGQLNGKTAIFINQNLLTNRGEEAWTVPNVVDSNGAIVPGYNAGEIIPQARRYGVWTVRFADSGDINDPLIRLSPARDVALDEKVYVRSGLVNANKEFYKDYDGFFHVVPVISSIQDTLYFQDGTDPSIYGTIKLIDVAGWNIDIENDILGKPNYTSPNGVVFTSGLKVKFSTDVIPVTYQNKEYYVEGVGEPTGMHLVDVELMIAPELYNDEITLNYPLTRIILNSPTVDVIIPGAKIQIGTVEVEAYYEAPKGAVYIVTLSDISAVAVGTSVTGTGLAAGTLVSGTRYDTVYPEYITINRSSIDLNAWSRTNRWFHQNIITATANYNKTQPMFDQDLRARRPIVQFESDLQLFNYGRIGKAPVDILDTTTEDAFNQLNGQTFTTAFGVTLFDGMRIIFANDRDPVVRDTIYVLNLVQTSLDNNGLLTGPKYINLNPAADGQSEPYDTVVITKGVYKGTQWWYNGDTWIASQQKTSLQQDPLFDIYDNAKNSISQYQLSTFAGTKLFGYNRSTTSTTIDPVLDFPLTYTSFQTQGNIEFVNYFDVDTFNYVSNNTQQSARIATGFLQKIMDRYTTVPKNNWNTVAEKNSQYQLITYIYDGINSPFKIDVTIPPAVTIPYVKVYKNNKFLNATQWTLSNGDLTLSTSPALGDKIDILVYSNEVSRLGQYQLPKNLELNAQNIDLTTMTLGQLRNHLIELSQNSTELVGDVLSSSNLRDIEIKSQGGTILQHSAPISNAVLFLLNDNTNFIDAVRYAQQEYARFKNKFLELSATLSGIQPTDPVASVDLILTEINKIKNKSFPWFYSDMVPYGTLKNIVNGTGYTIFDPLVRSYEITKVFDAFALSNNAVLVYLNDVQLIIDKDYTFDTDRPAITFADTITLEVDDIVKIVEYQDTNGSYVPETPTKLGLYPKFIPEIFEDDTYRTPINVIRGHDGSITPAFDDYRDSFILELEKRIYNNITLRDTNSYQDIYKVMPGKFRDNDYSLNEITQLVSKNFLNWIGNNKVDFTTNSVFDSNDPFTWNYGRFIDRIDGEAMAGSWRACYQYFYDTIRPHQTPWEMLGFSTMPSWWVEEYGPAPYTGGNKLLWDDLEAGLIKQGTRAGIDKNFARPGLSAVIPVDANGFLLSPAAIMTASFNSTKAATAWAVGQQGPVETAWRNSSDYPFAVQQALALAKPARYFGLLMDVSRYSRNTVLEQYVTDTNDHIQQTSLTFNGDTSTGTVVRTAGYINWIADFLVNQGINPSTVITPLLKNYEVNLAYKLAGFSDQKYLQVLAEQSSPSSTNDSIIIPNENYNVHLYKSTPVDKIVYSGVIIEKTSNGYSVRGYNLSNPYFTIIPSVINSNAYKITVLNNSVTVFRDYQNLKLTVPYGYEFTSQQQIADFLISYERHLIAQGFTFNDTDEQLGETRNWKLSTKEFLFWAQQGWTAGSILVLSPVANIINVVTVGTITDAITDSQYGSKVLDQNFALVKTTNYNVLRSPTAFKLTLTNGAVIGYIELNLVQYEHVLVFDNTTVFNDIIYKPELGNRQYRLKLVGQKTADWDGSLNAPGFIYNSGKVADWSNNKDYLKGDLVQYKNQYYVALQNVVAVNEFDFAYWKQIATSEIKKGLLPNFATIAAKSQVYYDSYTNFKDSDQIKYSHGLIGFKTRQYLADLGLSDTTQIELYKGFIKQKGSANAINQLTKAEFNNLSSAINFYEEWAIRVGEYGALDTNPYIEIALDEKAFSVNPAIASFVTDSSSNGVTTFNKSQLYKSTEQYTSKIALNRDAQSNYDNDIVNAGYVNIDDVDTTIFDLANFTDLNNQLSAMGTGYSIWCAKDFSQNWNVYRVTETDNHVFLVSNSLDGFVTFTTDDPHGLSAGDIFLIRSFATEFDGFYQVEEVVDLNNILVKYSGDTTQLTTIDGDGMLFILDSIRFQYMEDARLYSPKHQWKVGEKIWIDDDAETTVGQGQPVDTATHLWKVYEKTHPWEIDQRLVKTNDMYITFSNVALANATSTLTIGGNVVTNITTITGNAVGIISNFLTSSNASNVSTSQMISTNNIFPANTTVSSLTTNNEYSANIGYGQALKMIDNAEQTIFVGTTLYANLSVSTNTGAVNVFDKNTANVYSESTTITPDGANTFTYGSHIDTAVDGTQLRMAVSAPTSSGATGAANVGLIYTYNKLEGETVWNRGQVIVGNVNATGGKFGTGFAFDEFGHWLYVGAPYDSTSTEIPKVYVYGLNRFVTEATGNVTTSGSVSTVTVPFTPEVTNDANALVITSSTRTYIPNIDYTLSGTTITFISGNVNDTLTISQGPYYTLVGDPIEPPLGARGARSEFGFCIDASLNGAQLGVGAPGDTVNVAIFTDSITGVTVERSIPVGTNTASITVDGTVLTRVSYVENVSAGAVYVYDRVIEAFNSTAGTVYTTQAPIANVYRVTVDGIELPRSEYTATPGTNTVTLNVPLGVGKVVNVETNEFTLLERLIGIDSLDGSLTAIQEGARFGTALTICSNNCAFYIGAPYYNAGTIYNTGAVWKFHNRGTLYGTNTGYTQNPTFTPGNTIRLDNFQITVSTPAVGQSSLDSLVEDINDAKLLGITAVNEAGYLRLNSDKTVAKNRLRILSASGTVYADAGMAIFAFMQIIVNPYRSNNEYFGTKVILARNAYMLVISSERGTTKHYATFDAHTDLLYPNAPEYIIDTDPTSLTYNELIVNPEQYLLDSTSTLNNINTTLDDDSTALLDEVKASGSVYTYELYDDPRDQVENPGRYAFCQQLDPTDLNSGDGFGAAFDVIGGHIVVSAPTDDTTIENGGSIYLFNNTINKRGWSLIRYQQPRVDIESVSRMYLYSKLTNTILTTLEFIDPAKGKILGRAEQEISYKTGYDPAVYNRGTNSAVSLNDSIFWNGRQVGQVWWNLNQLSYIDYEQDSLTYRSINWGQLFPGSTVEVLEWVESSYLPSAYVANGGEGIPKYADDSAYVELIYVDPVTNIISIKYFYWVKDKTTVDPTSTTRRIPIVAIQDIIENPKNQGIPYAAIIQDNSFVVYNVDNYLSAQNTILHLDYNTVKNTNIIHSEYELVQKGNADSIISSKIINKLIDSLAGIDILGAEVPDPTLSPADKFGLGTRPRQTIFVDRLSAYANLVEYANNILITKPIARNYDLTTLSTAEPEPNFKLGEYDLKIETEIELQYLDTAVLSTGYKVLVGQNTTQDNLWVLYELSADKTWTAIRTQSYKTDLYWDYVDWYAPGYGEDTQLEYVVDTLTDALKLPVAVGDDVLVRVANGVNRGWNLLVLNSNNQFDVVGIENGTIQLKTSTGNFINNKTPTTEIRYIITALKDDIFVGELEAEFNKLFFVMINYLFNEQKYVDWIFKTSFISVSHKLRSLLQYPNYIKDNQTYYEDYISEVKPYSTKIREYSINYDSNDEFAGSVTDFDLPPYYDTETKVFRSPSGENIIKDEALWQTDTYNQWYANRNYRVESIVVESGGSGYTSEPIVAIVGGGTAASGATARAIIDFDLGTVIAIEILTNGSGYFQTPIVLINGSNTTPAAAYAVLKNNQVRTFDTTLKFDRISYTSSVQEWSANTAYFAGDIVTHKDMLAGGARTAYEVKTNIISSPIFVLTEDYTVYNSSNFNNANDRIVGYYDPTRLMPARDLNQLVRGIDYPGVKVQGLNFDQSAVFSGATKANITFNAPIVVNVGSTVTQPEADILMTFSHPIDATVGQFITQVGTDANVTVYGNDISTGNPGNIVNADSGYFIINTNDDFTSTGNIKIDGVEQVVNTYSTLTSSWSNVGITPVYRTIGSTQPQVTFNVGDAAITVTKIISANKIQGIIKSTADFITGNNSIRQGNIRINGSWQSIYPTSIEYIPNGTADQFDNGLFDQVQYDSDGTPMVDDAAVDTLIRSSYTDLAIGTRPEDINVVGGAYVDTYSSHAPEEMVPGIVFDTLDMQVYTKINGNVDVIAYRMFSNMMREESYLRIADAYSTTLAAPLGITDTEIVVADASKLFEPFLDITGIAQLAIPGVIFINGERITYYTRDLITNTLGQIRRGTQGTAIPAIQYAGTVVTDGSVDQIVPGVSQATVRFASIQLNNTITANVGDVITQAPSTASWRVVSSASSTANVIVSYEGTFSCNTGLSNVITINGTVSSLHPVNSNVNIDTPITRTVTSTRSYYLSLTGSVSANVGDVITQTVSGASLTVAGIDSVARVLLVIKNNTTSLAFQENYVTLSSNVTVSSGDYITQASTGANVTVLTTGANISNVAVNYYGITTLTAGKLAGNIAINGSNIAVYPTTVTGNAAINSEIIINGNSTGNVYPLSIVPVGRNDIGNPFVDSNGNVTIAANISLHTTNVWYNLGTGIATDGTGFDGATTVPVTFLKASTASNIIVTAIKDMITTEDAVNTLTTEDGNTIIED
jgi:hypothetical protein